MQTAPLVREIFPLETALKLAEALNYDALAMAELLPSAAAGYALALLERHQNP